MSNCWNLHIYRILVITIQSFKKCYFLRAYSICSRRFARPASSPSTRSRRRPASEYPCPRLGSAGLALGGATWRGAPLCEEPDLGSRRRPWSSLVAFAWATFGAEAARPAGGGASPCQGGRWARPSLHGCYGRRQVLHYLAGSLGRWPEIWSSDGSFSLGVHRPRPRNREWRPRFFCSTRSLLAS